MIVFVSSLIIGLLILVLPFQVLGFLAYFLGKPLSTSRQALLTVLTPAIAFGLVIIIMEAQTDHDAAGRVLGRMVSFLTFIIGGGLHIALSSLLLKLLRQKHSNRIQNKVV